MKTTDEIDREALTKMNGIVQAVIDSKLRGPAATDLLRKLRQDVTEKRQVIQKMRSEK